MKALPRQTLTERAAEAILDQILDQRLGVGDALPSTGELAARLDVSVVVVREALAALAGRGIIHRQQGRESVVARPGPEVLDSIFRVRMRQDSIAADEFQQCRAALELQATLLAAVAGDAAQRGEALAPFVPGLRTPRTLDALVDADRQFHLNIAELSGNRAVQLLVRSLDSVLRESIHLNWETLLRSGSDEDLDLAVDNHAAIADAIIAGDKRAAFIAMSRHFSYWGEAHGLDDIAEAIPDDAATSSTNRPSALGGVQ